MSTNGYGKVSEKGWKREMAERKHAKHTLRMRLRLRIARLKLEGKDTEDLEQMLQQIR